MAPTLSKTKILIVTTQSLNAPFPNDVIDFSYTPVRYSNVNYAQSNTNNTFAESQFLDESTVPALGEILLLTPYTITLATPLDPPSS